MSPETARQIAAVAFAMTGGVALLIIHWWRIRRAVKNAVWAVLWAARSDRCRCIPWYSPVGARHTKRSHISDCATAPPCGGCSRCIAKQYWYYAERNKINV